MPVGAEHASVIERYSEVCRWAAQEGVEAVCGVQSEHAG